MAAEVLLYADSHGIDSHGVGRLMTYVELLRAGKINPQPNITTVQQRKSAATIDGDNGLGLVVGPRANQMAAEMAQEYGTGWVSVCHTNHFGAAGFYVAQTVEKLDMIGWAMTNSSKLVAPLWGAEPMFGTNPIAFGAPANNQPPVIVDMATSAVPFGKVEIAMRGGQSLPNGWGIDKDGQPTHNPQMIIDGGSLLPLGSEKINGGHKGQCLLSMVDILCCVLSGANWGPFGPPSLLWQDPPEKQVGKGIGHFFGVMDIEAFRDKSEFKQQMDEWVLTIRGTKPQPGTSGPLIPGDPERLAFEDRSRKGIPIVEAVVRDLEKISSLTGVSLNQPSA
ncbi:MAG: Ldh family oxidoreductase [Cyclobacteriaceae bacterium]|nr:Ldh family oxidoreductase [Cyclobacteriaceae bacterium]